MKLQFSATQDYQLKAVKSVIDIFEGQPLAKGDIDLLYKFIGSGLKAKRCKCYFMQPMVSSRHCGKLFYAILLSSNYFFL